jgi:hypothetical protein
VTSLRAKRDPRDLSILLSMVDEYETKYELPRRKVSAHLTAEEVLVIFRDAEPTPTHTSCRIEFSSLARVEADTQRLDSPDKVSTSMAPRAFKMIAVLSSSRSRENQRAGSGRVVSRISLPTLATTSAISPRGFRSALAFQRCRQSFAPPLRPCAGAVSARRCRRSCLQLPISRNHRPHCRGSSARPHARDLAPSRCTSALKKGR